MYFEKFPHNLYLNDSRVSRNKMRNFENLHNFLSSDVIQRFVALQLIKRNPNLGLIGVKNFFLHTTKPWHLKEIIRKKHCWSSEDQKQKLGY